MSGPPDLRGLVPSKREDPPGPLVPFVPVAPKPKAPKKAKTPINPRNEARMEERNAVKFGPCSAMARLLACARCGRAAPSEPAHVRARGAGGDDHANVVPLCFACHRYQHDIGIPDFERKTGLDLVALAEDVAKRVAEHACAEFLIDPKTRKPGKTCQVCGAPVDLARRTP